MIDRRRFLQSTAALAVAGLLRSALAGSRVDAGRFDAAIARLKAFVDDGRLPFASLRIARRGRVLAQAQLSGVEAIGADSVYRIYSMTKPVVAAGTLLLVEDGELALDHAVARYVPELTGLEVATGPQRREPARPMLLGHLLSHSCGLANSWGGSPIAPLYREAGLVAAAWMYDPAIDGLAGFAERLGRLPLAFQPGTDWGYGYGLDVAGLVIERVSGERLGDFLRRRIFEPLGMASTAFFVPEARRERLAGLYAAGDGGIARVSNGSELAPLTRPRADAGSGGLVSTLEDYGRFADMLANGGARDGVRVMAADTVRTLFAPWQPQAPLLASLQHFGGYAPGSVAQALGGIVRTDDRSGPGSAGEYAWGGAAGTGFWSAPALGLSVTVMTQLMPATAAPARDALRPMVYEALAPGD